MTKSTPINLGNTPMSKFNQYGDPIRVDFFGYDVLNDGFTLVGGVSTAKPPTWEELDQLKVGSLVKLGVVPDDATVTTERMWFRIKRMPEDAGFPGVAECDNTPYDTRAPVKYQEHIAFQMRDVIDIYRLPDSGVSK